MENRIPLPTDNVFKFYGLLGLILVVFGFSAVIYTTKSTNDFMAVAYVELAALKGEDLSAKDKARLQVLERQVDVAEDDKEFFKWGAAILSGVGLIGVIVGFGRWESTHQRYLDEYARLQNEKLRAEIKALKRSARKR